MKILNTLTIRHIFKNKKRSLVTLIGITLTSTLLFIVGFIYGTYREQEIKNVIDIYGSQDAVYSNIPFNNKTVFETDIIDKYDYFTKKYDTDITTTTYSELGQKEENVPIYTTSDNFNLNLDKGNKPTNSTELVISKYYANKLNLKIGDKYTFNLTDINGDKLTKEYTICGLYNEDKTTMYVREEKFFTKEEVTDEDTYFYIYLKDKTNAYEKLYKIGNDLNLEKNYQYGKLFYQDAEFNDALLMLYGNYENKMEKAIIYVSLMIILTVISIFCATLVYNSFAISLMERTKQIGILKSVGTTNRQVRKMIFKEALYLSIVAIPLGFLLSYGLTSLAISIINNLLVGVSTNLYVVSIYPNYLLISLIFIILTIIYSAFFPSVTATLSPPIESIRGNNNIKNKYKRKPNKLISKLFNISGLISFNSIKRNKSKYRITVFAVTVSFLLFMTVSTFINFYQKQIMDPDSISQGLYVTMNKEGSKQIIDEIKSLDTVNDYVTEEINWILLEKVDNLSKDYLIDNNSKDIVSTMYLLNQEKYEELKKELNITNDNPIYLNYYKNEEYYTIDGIKIPGKEGTVFDYNKEIELCSFDFKYDNETRENIYTKKKCLTKDFNLVNKEPKSLKGFSHKYQKMFIVNEKLFNDFEKSTIDNEIIAMYINSNDYVKIDKQINEIYKNSSSVKDFYYHNYSLENLGTLRTLLITKIVIYSLIILFSMIAISSIVNTIVANMSLRKREFAILKSVGLDNKQFDKMLLLEGIFLSIKSLIFAIPLSLIVTYLVNNLVNIGTLEKYKFKDIFAYDYFILGIIMVFVVINLTIYLSTRNFKKQNIIEDVKNENV